MKLLLLVVITLSTFPQQRLSIPTEHATRQYAGCVTVAVNEAWATSLCRVENLNNFGYMSNEKRANEDGVAELNFPLKPEWRWTLPRRVGVQFYFEQVSQPVYSPGENSLKVCRLVYSPDQLELRLLRQVATGNCDD